MSSSHVSSTPSVVVIGGTGGIGFAIAKFYSDRGCKVVITGRDLARTAAVRGPESHDDSTPAARSGARLPQRSEGGRR